MFQELLDTPLDLQMIVVVVKTKSAQSLDFIFDKQKPGYQYEISRSHPRVSWIGRLAQGPGVNWRKS
jgi:hypothetical protein